MTFTNLLDDLIATCSIDESQAEYATPSPALIKASPDAIKWLQNESADYASLEEMLHGAYALKLIDSPSWDLSDPSTLLELLAKFTEVSLNSELQDNYYRLRESYASSFNAIHTLKSSFKELQSKKPEHLVLAEEVASLEDEIDELEVKCSKLKDKVQDCNIDLADLEKEEERLEALIEKLNREIAENEKSLSAFKSVQSDSSLDGVDLDDFEKVNQLVPNSSALEKEAKAAKKKEIVDLLSARIALINRIANSSSRTGTLQKGEQNILEALNSSSEENAATIAKLIEYLSQAPKPLDKVKEYLTSTGCDARTVLKIVYYCTGKQLISIDRLADDLVTLK